MRTIVKLTFAALAAAILLASAVATASAGRLSASEQSIRASWASLEFQSSVGTIRCRVTLQGSFHSRTIAKVARSLIGAITRVIVQRPCTNGEAWADNGAEIAPLGQLANRLPFHITYEGFGGSLPNISSIGLLLSRVSFYIQKPSGFGFDVGCRYGTSSDNISGTATRVAGGGITQIAPVAGRNSVSLFNGLVNSGFCPSSGEFAGNSGPVTGLSNANTITITLI